MSKPLIISDTIEWHSGAFETTKPPTARAGGRSVAEAARPGEIP
ncbi:hypothetical protein [Burkholderia humptydooensis]|nr:hypothetical protein [Burkholderia humptydooensis]